MNIFVHKYFFLAIIVAEVCMLQCMCRVFLEILLTSVVMVQIVDYSVFVIKVYYLKMEC